LKTIILEENIPRGLAAEAAEKVAGGGENNFLLRLIRHSLFLKR